MSKVKENFLYILVISFAILIGITLTIYQVVDYDFWWHVKTGEYILNIKQIPYTDIFSWYGIQNNLNWIAHEWLSDVIFALLNNITYSKAFIFFPPLMFMLVFFFSLKDFREKIKESPYICLIWIIIYTITVACFSSHRPMMFSLLFFSLTIYIVNKHLNSDTKIIWFLPFISTLWVNLHGGSSSLLFVVIIMSIICNLFNFKYAKIISQKTEKKKITTLLSVLIASILSSLINPYTYKILLYPASNMLDTTMIENITEWQSPNFHNPLGIIIFICLVFVFCCLIITKKDIKIFDLLTIVAFAYLSLKSARLAPYFAIAANPVVIKYIEPLDLSKIKFIKYIKNITNNILVIMITSLLFISVFNIAQIWSKPLNPEKNFPVDAIPVIEKYAPKKMLNEYDWGGFLIWELHDKGINVFIDGRADIFSKVTMKDYVNILKMKENYEELVEKYDFDAIFLSKNQPLTKVVAFSKDWKKVYEDNLSIFFVKEGEGVK